MTHLVAQGLWRHIQKSGEVFDVEVTTQGIPFAGRKGLLAVLRTSRRGANAEQQAAEQGVYLQALLLNLAAGRDGSG